MAKRMTKKQKERQKKIQLTVAVILLLVAVLLFIFARDTFFLLAEQYLGWTTATTTEATTATTTTATTIPPYQVDFDLNEIPAFVGQEWVEINYNRPYFLDEEKVTNSYEYYSPLDSLGRCGYAMACIGKDIMPEEEREGQGSVTPSGWINVKYECVSAKYLYNRCHLIGYQLTGENDNKLNLITGTRFLNVDAMLVFENKVAKYMEQNPDNHVMYRVTPIYIGDNLVASGVLMEGYSVEDNGEGISFCIYAYNAQPHIVINYLTGESYHDDNVECDKYN